VHKYDKTRRGMRGTLRLNAAMLGMAFAAMQAHAVATTQTLDRVYAFGPQKVVDMATGNASSIQDFTLLQATGSSINTCALTAVSGLYCLDGKSLRLWTDPEDSGSSMEVLNCTDRQLDYTRKGEDCTAMTVDAQGTIWLAGARHKKAQDKLHSVFKIIARDGACPSTAWVTLAGGTLCALEQYYGLAPLLDLTPVDGDAAEDFPLHAGVLGLADRNDAVFFPDVDINGPTVLVSSRQWGIKGKESLQEVTLLQIPNGSVVDNYIVATTTYGRILAKNMALSGNAYEVFDITSSRTGATQCYSNGKKEDPQYGIRSSSTAPILYASDGNYCLVMALAPDSAAFNNLEYVQRNGVDILLSTAIPGHAYPPIGLTVAPGIGVKLSLCSVSCGIVNDANGDTAARLEEVTVVDESKSGATVFQVKNIPDCRYASHAGFPSNAVQLCLNNPDSVVDPDATGAPSGQWLNVTPLLPNQVINAFKHSGYNNGVLPDLLISPPYRGQGRNGYTFEALFVLTKPDIQYTGVFTGEFNVAGLEGSTASLGCEHVTGEPLIKWDLVTTVSEYYVGYGGNKVDMLANYDCGSTRTIGVRLSLLSYDLEPAPDTWGPTISSTTAKLTEGNDAVFARLVERLYNELGYAQHELACIQVDTTTSTVAPLNSTICGSLDAKWQEGKENLDMCIAGSFRSAAEDDDDDDEHHHHHHWWWWWLGHYLHLWDDDDDEEEAEVDYCQLFVDSVTAYQALIPAGPTGPDVANRVSELQARITTLLHVYNTRFLPSIPEDGFCRELDPLPSDCPNPWY
jgi:hypothetical protein